ASGTSRLWALADGDDVARSRAAIEGLGVKVRDGAGSPAEAVVAGERADPVVIVRGAGFDGLAEPEAAIDCGNSATSALLLAGLQAAGATEVTEPALSRDHTERLLPAMGAVLEAVPGGVRVEPAGGGALRPIDLAVPGDPSAAAFFVVGACVTPGSDLVGEDGCLHPTRLGFIDVLLRMGADVEVVVKEERGGEPVGDIRAAAGPLRATRIAGDEIPRVIDEIPALAVAAAFA